MDKRPPAAPRLDQHREGWLPPRATPKEVSDDRRRAMTQPLHFNKPFYSVGHNWTCPACRIEILLDQSDQQISDKAASLNGEWRFVRTQFVRCRRCGEIAVTVGVYVPHSDATQAIPIPADRNYFAAKQTLFEQRILPWGTGKKYNDDDGVPAPIRADFEEAHAIRTLSPRASATLARRCMQAVIRDVYELPHARTLADELKAAKEKMEPDLWRAMDALRTVGNIGAHMERDMDTIVDVDPEEASKLLRGLELR